MEDFKRPFYLDSIFRNEMHWALLSLSDKSQTCSTLNNTQHTPTHPHTDRKFYDEKKNVVFQQFDHKIEFEAPTM